MDRVMANLIIGDQIITSSNDNFINVINPANQKVVGKFPEANEEEVKLAINSAREAFPKWKDTSFEKRAQLLHSVAKRIEKEKVKIGEILTKEQGKPLSEAVSEVETVVEFFHFYAEEAKRIEGTIVQNSKKNYKSLITKQPVGVCALITPWNYPLVLLGQKLAPALAAGCTVVIKPPSLTPLAAYKIVECVVEDELFQKGIVNFITGSGKKVGSKIINSKLIDKISFTGSTATGKKLLQASSSNVKRLSLELGGHSPIIVWRDADLETAIAAVTKRAFRNMGQICNSLNRIYIHEEIFDEFVDGFISKTKELEIGNGLKGDKDLGPMADKSGLEKLKKHIEDAKQKGANILYGGQVPKAEKFEEGNYFEPTILKNMKKDMLMMKEETFGPVAPLIPVKNANEAISLANDTEYGLVSYAYTSSLKLANRFAEELQAGTVVINHVSPTSIYAPYGGIKESGFGRELGRFGMDEYLYDKHVHINLGEHKV